VLIARSVGLMVPALKPGPACAIATATPRRLLTLQSCEKPPRLNERIVLARRTALA